VFIILNTAKIFDKRIGHIKYRNNVVTGEIATVNGNNTYDVYISGSDVAYPNIPTTVKEPDFEVGEAVEILIEYGNKEMPIIIGHAKKVAQEFVEDEINVLVTTLDAYSITETSAYLEGRIEEIEGYENVTRRGFYYGTSTGYGSDVYSTGSFAAGSYNKQITGLTAGTTYHYQAYVYDAYNDVHTGEDKIMTTVAEVSFVMLCYLPDESSSDSKLRLFDSNGVYTSKEVDPEVLSYNQTWNVTMDSDGNTYFYYNAYVNFVHYCYLKKYDSDLNLLINYDLYQNETRTLSGLRVSSDGYLYSNEYDYVISKRLIVKRKLSDLSVVSTIVNLSDEGIPNAGTLALDSDTNIYINETQTHTIYKYDKEGNYIATSPPFSASGFCRYGAGVMGNYGYFALVSNKIAYFPLDLSSMLTWEPAESWNVFTIRGNYLYGTSYINNIYKYDSDRNLVATYVPGYKCYGTIGSYQF